MQDTELNFDHLIDLSDLRAAIATAMGTDAVSIWNPDSEPAEHDIIVTTENLDGDFPLLVLVTDMNASEPLSITQVRYIAQSLHSVVLTDSIDAGLDPLYDDGYTMISPDGMIEVLRADESGLEAGQLNLTPESQQRYVQAVTRMSPVPAD